MRLPSRFLVLAVTALTLAVRADAQTSSPLVFERYLEALRLQAGIPGLSAVIVHDGEIVWERGFGHRDVENLLPVFPDTPFPVSHLTQTVAATLAWGCVERGELELTAPVAAWSTMIEEPSVQVRHVLAHASDIPAGSAYRFDPSRYASLTPVIDGCYEGSYRRAVAREILDRFAMVDSSPGQDLATPTSLSREQFEDEDLDKYTAVLARLAVPYRLDRGKPVRSEYLARGIDASGGLVASARDLARFDGALTRGDLLLPETLSVAWTNTVSTGGAVMPTGLGWFVQNYNGHRVVWHFGLLPNASSSMVLKVPGRGLTLILLANSDGLSAPFGLHEGDVTASPFARLFLRLFLL